MGVLSFAQFLAGTNPGNLAVALGGTDPGTGCPRIHFAGTVALGGTFTERVPAPPNVLFVREMRNLPAAGSQQQFQTIVLKVDR